MNAPAISTPIPDAAADPKFIPEHDLTRIFPLIDGDEFNALIEDIRESGLRTPIVLFEGKILDGRNRYRACCKAGIEPILRDFDPDKDGDPRAFVIGMNVHRRHLTESERAVIVLRSSIREEVEAAADARMKAGTAGDPSTPGSQGVGKTSELLGRVAGVSASLIDRALYLDRYAPKLLDRVLDPKDVDREGRRVSIGTLYHTRKDNEGKDRDKKPETRPWASRALGDDLDAARGTSTNLRRKLEKLLPMRGMFQKDDFRATAAILTRELETLVRYVQSEFLSPGPGTPTDAADNVVAEERARRNRRTEVTS